MYYWLSMPILVSTLVMQFSPSWMFCWPICWSVTNMWNCGLDPRIINSWWEWKSNLHIVLIGTYNYFPWDGNIWRLLLPPSRMRWHHKFFPMTKDNELDVIWGEIWTEIPLMKHTSAVNLFHLVCPGCEMLRELFDNFFEMFSLFLAPFVTIYFLVN